jgi:Ca2+-transporting ATPase
MEGHNKSAEELYEELDSRFEGLSSEEAEKKLLEHGENVIPSGRAVSPWKILLHQFTDLLVIILLVSGLITGIVGIIEQDKESIVEIVAIFVVVAINAGLGFYQELSAEKAINSLKSLAVSEVIVVRDEKKILIKSELIVPGDIVSLEAGSTIAADIRLVESYEIRTIEGILTGESLPIKKHTKVLSEKTPLADRKNMLYKGTTVVNGSGIGIVVATGLDTELGKIASSLMEIEQDDTPIQKKLTRLAKQLTIAIAVLSVIILLVGIFLMEGTTISETIIFAIGLAVAAVPEGLPVVLTLTMAIGITRMARKRSLIRKLPAVEVLGSATIICSDKTGTLTKNEMTAKNIWTLENVYNITGTGYSSEGGILYSESANLADVANNASLLKSVEICTLANEASITPKADDMNFEIFGDPTEVSLLILAEKSGLKNDIEENWARQYLFPFDSERKRMSVIVKNAKTGQDQLMVKGATDVLLELCDTKYVDGMIQPLESKEKQEILEISNSYSANYAYRILGLAMRNLDHDISTKLILSGFQEEAEKDLTFVGFVSMIDPPRDQSKPSIERAREAGIKVTMITGDHMSTARAIGKAITLCKDTEPISGRELDEMSDEKLYEAVDETEIFARVNPAHKLRIVNALKRNGEVVIMTGDGVNDAPALKRADVGVAMGIAGTDVSKEASDMILVDDNFANIIDAVSEGRLIYDNMKKFIAYLLSANAGEILTVLFGLVIGAIVLDNIVLPVLAIQLLFINIVTDAFPALALGVSAPEENVMQRPPRDPQEPLLDKVMLIKIALTGVLYAIGSMFVFYWAIGFGSAVTEENIKIGQTMVFASLVIYQLANSLSTSRGRTIFSRKVFQNKQLFGAILLGVILLMAAVYIPFLQPAIKTYPLSAVHWGIILLTMLPIAAIEELRKFIVNKIQPERYVPDFDPSVCL